MEKKPLRLLILEDNSDDAELAVQQLEREGFIVEWSRVETEKAFREALGEKPDLILADYALPSFSGIGALEIQQEIAPEIPLVIISGTVGEEVTVECIKFGATDYVLKGRLFRLGPVVKRALEEAKVYRARKRAEEALRESEERFRNLFEDALIGIYRTTSDGRILIANPALVRMLGFASFGELAGRNLEETTFAPGYSRSIFKQRIESEGQVIGLESAWPRRGGVTLFVRESATAVRDEAGNTLYYEGTVEDITERVRAEEALKEAQRYTRGLIKASLDALVTISAEGKITDVNRATELLTGISRQEIIGAAFSIYFTDPDAARKVYQRVFRDGYVLDYFLEVKHRDGKVTPVLYNASVYRDAQGHIAGVFAAARDITERVRAEDERERLLVQVQEQAQQVQQIMNTVPDGVLLLDAAGQVILANPVGEEDLIVLADARVGATLTYLGDRPLAELLAPPPEGLWHEVTTFGSAGPVTLTSSVPALSAAEGDRPERTFEIIARPIEVGPAAGGWVLVVREVTQEREIQQRVQQQDRLAAVGQLAAGIAHDFNNIMAAILLYAQLSAKDPHLPDRVQERMVTIVEQSRRAADLINQILDFSRSAVLERKALDLASVLKEQVKLLQRTIPESIRVELVVGPDECTVSADLTRMQQVVMNLAVNARDAMPAGGVLRIGLERVQKELETETGIVDGEWVQLTVTDGGTGIPAEALPHIFEPFFTTKARGEGTGLGLAQVYGIVKQHEGHIDVTTRMGKGTTFTVYLPALLLSEPESPAGESAGLIQGQGETVLVVEDNPDARQAMVESLEVLNYRVLEAENGREALALFEQRRQEIALVLSDLVMPEMGGMELCSVLRRLDPAVRVVLLTGYPLEKKGAELRTAGVMDWLPKPVSLKQLAQVVARVMQKRSNEELEKRSF